MFGKGNMSGLFVLKVGDGTHKKGHLAMRCPFFVLGARSWFQRELNLVQSFIAAGGMPLGGRRWASQLEPDGFWFS